MSSNGEPTTQQSSSILFFIAVGVGIAIALVFVFFSLRYYVRTKLGIYSSARLTTAARAAGGGGRGVVLLNGDFPLQQFNIYHRDIQAHVRAHRRRRKYLKKRRLTEEEVDHLFPSRTYQNWLDGGAQRDIENRAILEQLKEEHDEAITFQHEEDRIENEATQQETETENQQQTTHDASAAPQESSSANNQVHPQPTAEVDLGNPFVEEIHYDSGACAICIDSFEAEDIVRGLICGHVFHQECLDPWLTKRKACCPMCKRDYYMKNDDEAGNSSENGIDDQNDVDSVNGWPELQFTTLEDRAAEILQRSPELEAVANEKLRSYSTLKWRFFWVIMGISRRDLLNCTIVSEDDRRREAAFYTQNETASVTEFNNEQNVEENDAAADVTAPHQETEISELDVTPSPEVQRQTVEGRV